MRVEVNLSPDSFSRIPAANALPGRLDVEVERVAPARLFLESLGAPALAAPSSDARHP